MVLSWVRRYVEGGRSLARSRALARRYDRAVAERIERYRGQDLGFTTERVGGRTPEDVVRELDERGFVILEDVFPTDGLEVVLGELQAALVEGRVHSSCPAGPVTGDLAEVPSKANLSFARDPFVDCPSALRYAFSDEVIDLAHAAYGCPPCLVAGKVMRTYVNDVGRQGFYWFHADSQAARIVKFFFYLRDVDEGAGPFCYVEGSHERLPRALRATPFHSDEEVARHFGPRAIHHLTARAGSVVIANTVGLHRASKPTRTERNALLIATGVHEWPGPVRLRSRDLAGATAKQRAMADLAQLVD